MNQKNYSFKIPGRTAKFRAYYFLIAFAISFLAGHSQQSYTFTNASATGSLGPTQAQVTTAYATTNLSGNVTVAGSGIQVWTVPITGGYRIETYGAEGGTSSGVNPGANGGRGAVMKGEFNLTAGQTLSIVVGQRGSGSNYGGSGGGGSYVVAVGNIPLSVAGGGGGAIGYPGYSNGYTDGGPGTITTTGGDANVRGGGTYGVQALGTGGGAAGFGGTNGYGGGSGVASAGGGFIGDGANGGTPTNPTYSGGGKSYLNGATGGVGAQGIVNSGGFGGGGGTQSASGYGAGGGGYSGGGGGSLTGGASGNGGGGGSFNSGANQVNAAGTNTAHGKVIITELCNISFVASGTNTNGAICSGQTITITTNAVSNYSWSTGPNPTNSVIVSPTVTTTYTLSATSSSNCTAYAALTVTVDTSIPTLTVTNTANAGGICPTKTVALTATGATTYSWTGGAATVTNGVAFAPPTASDYTVTGRNACGSASVVTTVSVHPLPTVIAVASSASLCSGLTLTLNTTGSNASTYTWTGGQTSGVGFSPVLTATYTVIGTSALSCTASAAVPVTVVTTPVIPPTSNTLINCIGNSVTLTAIGATNYTWTSATQTVFTATLAATPSATGISTYTVTKSNSNCVDTKTISVTTNSLPTIFAIVSPTLVCALSPATLAVGGGVSYTWTAPGSPTTSFNGAAPVVYPLAPSVYTVAASDGTCINRTTVSLAVNPNPTISVSSPTAICDGQSVTVNALGGINYTWTSTSGGAFQNTLTITDTPTTTVAYTIIGDNSFGCTSSVMQVVLVNPNPTITISASRTLVCSNANTTLTANGANSYTWTGNSATTNTTLVNPVSLISAPVIYTAVGSYTTGCVGSKTFAVNVYVPVLTVSGNTNTCIGGMLSLSAGGGNNGTYIWNTGTSNSNFQNLTTTLSAATVFTLSASSTSITTNCPATKTVGVGTYFNPTITAVAERTTICNKESTKLYGDGGVSYTWNNSAQGGTITVSPTAQTNYTVTGTDANGCVSTGTVQVKVSGCVGINELTNSTNSLLIYPNPNNGEFTIQSSSKVSLTLVNELGQVITTYDLSGANEYKASVKDLAKGIYFITGQNVNQKVIVTK